MKAIFKTLAASSMFVFSGLAAAEQILTEAQMDGVTAGSAFASASAGAAASGLFNSTVETGTTTQTSGFLFVLPSAQSGSLAVAGSDAGTPWRTFGVADSGASASAILGSAETNTFADTATTPVSSQSAAGGFAQSSGFLTSASTGSFSFSCVSCP